MKTSRYNYYLPYKEGKYIFFNGLTKRFFTVSENNYNKFRTILSNPNDYLSKYSTFLDKMRKDGFVLDSQVNEIDLVQEKFEEMRNKNDYMLIIFPTYRCNFKCWYCVQDHENLNLSEDDFENIKNHIRSYLLENNIQSFTISWFGGEPMLSFEKIVDLASFAKEFCKEQGINFQNEITTNGAFLSKGRLKIMEKLDFKSFQITIDGNREMHNRTRHDPENSSFDVILKNCIHAVDLIPEIRLVLRFNYSADNMTEEMVRDVNSCIPEEYRSRIKLLFQKIWQINEETISQEKYQKLRKMFRQSGYQLSKPFFSSCYAEKYHINTIFPNGKIEKCNNLPLDNLRGILTKKGTIEWQNEIFFTNHNNLSPKSPCRNCKYLPVCWGPCPRNREEMIKRNTPLACHRNSSKKDIKREIIEYCESYL